MSGDQPPSFTLEVVTDLQGEFAERVVEAFHYRADELFRVGLTSGDVARSCYERLASHGETQIDWWSVDVWTPDPDLAREALLNHVGAAYAVHRLGPDDPAQPPLDFLHLDLSADATAVVGTWPMHLAQQVVITAAGAECAGALAALRATVIPWPAAVRRRPVVLLADRAALGELAAHR